MIEFVIFLLESPILSRQNCLKNVHVDSILLWRVHERQSLWGFSKVTEHRKPQTVAFLCTIKMCLRNSEAHFGEFPEICVGLVHNFDGDVATFNICDLSDNFESGDNKWRATDIV